MLYRRFGRTELQMPVFSTGGMRYQHAWQDKPLSEIPDENQQNLEAVINHSVTNGINHIETARGYGSSERQLGLILPRFPRNEIIVQTKVGPEADSELFRRNFMESLERLQLNYVDLLGIHGINNDETHEWATRKGGCLDVARQLQEQGLLRHVGFSTHGSCATIIKAIQTTQYGGFDYVNLHWYNIYQRNWPAVLAANKHDMGVFIISPTDKGGMLYNAPQRLRELTAPLDPIVFNDLFCLNRPEVHTLSIGAAKTTDYDLHLQAIELYDKRDEYLPAILERLDEANAAALGTEYAHNYLQGIPEWEQIPGEINAQIILWLLNLKEVYGMEEYARMRYNLLGNASHWFPGKNAAELNEAEFKAKIPESPVKDRIIQNLHQAHSQLYTAPAKRLSES